MAIQITEVLPLLETLSTQQHAISTRLTILIEIFSSAPKPVEPALRSILKPLREGIDEIEETLRSTSNRSI